MNTGYAWANWKNGAGGEKMKLNDYLKQNADGTYEIDTAAFEADLDRERNKASDTAKKNTESKLRGDLEKEIRAKLEEEAKQTAEEKLQKQIEAFAEQKRAFDKKQVTAIYKDAGISDEEIELMLALVGEDSEKNIENAQKIADARKKFNEENKKKIREELIENGVRPDGNGGDDKKTEDEGEKYAKLFSTKAEGNDYVDLKAGK